MDRFHVRVGRAELHGFHTDEDIDKSPSNCAVDNTWLASR